MKKLLLTITFFLAFAVQSVQAEQITVIAKENFSTANPADTFKVQIIEEGMLDKETLLPMGSILCGKVTKISNAKRLKRDGYFELTPECIIIKNKSYPITNQNIKIKIIAYRQSDPSLLVKKAAFTTAGFFVKGAAQCLTFAEGIINAENGERIKSGVQNVYKNSPLVYIEMGEELEIKVNDVLVLIPQRKDLFKKFKNPTT